MADDLIQNSMAGSQPVPANFDASDADNLEDIEKQFAVKGTKNFCQTLASSHNFSARQNLTCFSTAVQHLETYWAILEKVKGSTLRLTKIDDEIYEHLCKDFPEFDPAETIDESKLKSPTGKKRWRDFMMAYEKKVDDYSFGTMLRTSPKEEYTQHGTIFVPRMQFYAVEIARNRKGLNDWIYEKTQAEKAETK
ncbi:hypothetical protein N8I77_012721 [Diaporthe amygdali]|uniref:Protein PBDC1 homolog n=1 Tax=Phomopsis amygdali TaxID=1214568 RepID=A0AAD9S2W6_PHOAM|nr:hypothetical protein N8I77_012721 [Diaporthe amygdali]